ncbi:MAG TPA: hypothetical protein VEK57_27945 [Thermoanaerobaculia bacterium]|nr:hypothetical protein [Thermoanaerobaculia bacterium]
MVFTLEALPAQHGDSLLLHFGTKQKPGLVMIDAGPDGVLADATLPRLQAIHKARGGTGRLFIDLGCVSHIDDDHVNGIDVLTGDLVANNVQPVIVFERFWHNSFNDLIDDDDAELGTAKTVVNAASLGGSVESNTSAVIASVSQGRRVRQNLISLGIDGNKPFNSLILAGHKKSPFKLGNLKITVVAPLMEQVVKLQKKWDIDLKAMKKAKTSKAEVAEFLDNSVPNLSSIVLLVESGKKKMLLTGDGRGDHTLAGLEKTGIVKKGGKLHVDILKLPHHGSVRNVDASYFKRITADHYIASANGRDGNPDVPTLQLISKARPDDDFVLHFTHPLDEFIDQAVAKKIKAFLAKETKAGRKYEVRFREKNEPSVSIAL